MRVSSNGRTSAIIVAITQSVEWQIVNLQVRIRVPLVTPRGLGKPANPLGLGPRDRWLKSSNPDQFLLGRGRVA